MLEASGRTGSLGQGGHRGEEDGGGGKEEEGQILATCERLTRAAKGAGVSAGQQQVAVGPRTCLG